MNWQVVILIIVAVVMILGIAIPAVLVRKIYRHDNVTETDAPQGGCFYSFLRGILFRFMLVAYIAAFFPLWMGLSDYATLMESKNWRSTEGSIIGTSIDEDKLGSIPYYTVQVSYEYTDVQDSRPDESRDLQRTTIMIRDFPFLNREDAEAQADKYPRNSSVTVYYDPTSYPVTNSVLERSLRPESTWMVGGSIVLLLLSSLIFFAYLKPIRIMRVLAEKSKDALVISSF